MRVAYVTFAAVLGFAASAVSVNAAPNVPSLDTVRNSNVVEVAGGCGRGFHPNPWGRCVPHRYGFYGPRRDRGYPYYGGGYGPRSWSPSDRVANELNRRELHRNWGY